MITKIKLYGERCSGTNYAEQLITKNFKVNVDSSNKHFFGFEKFTDNNNNTLYLCIVRNITDWINSLYMNPWHLEFQYKIFLSEEDKKHYFLNNEVFSVDDYKYNYKTWRCELLNDRNIYTLKRYDNIFQLRSTKLQYMLEDLPKNVQYSKVIRYEDLCINFEKVLYNLKSEFNLIYSDEFPTNFMYYKKHDTLFKDRPKQKKSFENNEIIMNSNVNLKYEKLLNYI